jgi:hypothetical protein
MSLPEMAMGGLQLAGGGIQAGGALAAGSQTAAIDRYDAGVAAANGQQALLASQTNAQIEGQNQSIAMGRAAAAFGAGGVTGGGSPLAVMASLAAAGELNKRLALQAGTLAAQAGQRQAALYQAEGGEASTAADIKAGGTLLTGAGQFLMAGKQAGWWSPPGGPGSSPAVT